MASTLWAAMPRKKQPPSEFGVRLMKLRQERGLTQVQLGYAASTTQRAISYYETEAEWPTVPQLIALAKALAVTADELLGLKAPSKVALAQPGPEERRLLRHLKGVAELPERDRRAVLRHIDTASRARRSA